jgi:formylglycine-generating enzyme required for sulfatase activity
MTTMKRALFAVLFVAACNDHPNQLVVGFDTDAPIGAANNVDPLDGPTPLFDRLRIDVLQPDGNPCSGCSNDFAVTSDAFTALQVSIGVPLPSQSGWTLRARLYVARFANGGEPNADASIDVRVSLPDASNNPGTAGVFLSTDTAGVVSDASAPAPLGSPISTSAVGTWPGAKRVGCDESGLPRPPNTACVAGGAYWMGTEDGQSVAGRSSNWHRLAVMSPYYIDVAEVTVGAYRAHNMVPLGVNIPSDTSQPAYCTFTTSPGPYEALPVNCVDFGGARLYCKSFGGDFPTSAQLERLATRFGRSPFVWGFDEPSCDDATFADCSTNGCYFDDPLRAPCFRLPSPSPMKNASGSLGGPVAPPSCTIDAPCPQRDALVVGDAVVVDLAGNVSEFTSDRIFTESDPCFSDHVITDPSCPYDKKTIQVRGGSFSIDAYSPLRGDAVLNTPQASAFSADVGFRCAYPATPAQ